MIPQHIPHPRYMLFLAGLLLGGVFAALMLPPIEALLVGFDVGVAVFVLSCISLWKYGQAESLRQEARDNDAGRILLLLLTLVIAAIIVAALGLLVLLRETARPC